jgi:membrane protein implicated in regulation of membrane protease activity
VISAALTGAGGLGWLALETWDLGVGGSIAIGLLGGLGLGGVTFATLAFLFKKLQSSSHVVAASLIGTRAAVDTAIDTGASGAIVVEASGSRMVVPARSVDAATIPAGAEVEIVRVDGAGYHVKETRESWLARSKGAAH